MVTRDLHSAGVPERHLLVRRGLQLRRAHLLAVHLEVRAQDQVRRAEDPGDEVHHRPRKHHLRHAAGAHVPEVRDGLLLALAVQRGQARGEGLTGREVSDLALREQSASELVHAALAVGDHGLHHLGREEAGDNYVSAVKRTSRQNETRNEGS